MQTWVKEVSVMQDSESTRQKYSFFCFRCGCVINAGENMVSLSVSIETPTEDGGLEGSEATTISSLCSGCSAILLSQAVMRDPDLMMPLPEKSLMEREVSEWENDISLN